MTTLRPDEHLVSVNGVRLRVRDVGTGEPLVLVHASLEDHREWAPLEDELASDFRLVSYARRGHADSEDGTAPGRRVDDEDDLAALLQLLDLAPANVIGNSFGASVALGLTARRPDLIQTLCIHEPPLLDVAADDAGVTSARQAVDSIRARIEAGADEAAVRDFIDDIVIGPGTWEILGPDSRADMVAAAGTFAEELRDPDWAAIDVDALRRGCLSPALGPQHPGLLLTTGEESPAFLRTVAQRLSEVDGVAATQQVPGAGHIPHVTHTATYAATIRDFIAAERERSS